MREMTVRICFTKPSLGSVKRQGTSNLVFARTPSGAVAFLPTWHKWNMHFASQLVGKHVGLTNKILWDVNIDGRPRSGEERWYRRYYTIPNGRRSRYSLHEAFQIGHTIGINCVVPTSITDDDFWELMATAGRFRGLSPFLPMEYGLYEVVSLRRRRPEQVGGEKP